MAAFALKQAARSVLQDEEIREAQRIAAQAYRQAPDSPEALLAGWVWAERARVSGLLETPQPDLGWASQSAGRWEQQGHSWMRSNRWAEAVLAYSRALAASERQGNPAVRAAQVRLFRAAAFRRLGLCQEAGRDNCQARGIPLRLASAPVQLVDLSAVYNAPLKPNWHGDRPGNDLAALPTGLVELGGVRFDVRGLIQLQAQAGPAMKQPLAVTNIAVGQRCRRLHVLHAATHCKDDPPGTEVGRIVLDYSGGERQELPVVLGEHLRDWWTAARSSGLSRGVTVAWLGSNEASHPVRQLVGLFCATWENPVPVQELRSLDLRSSQNGPGWFVVAITLE